MNKKKWIYSAIGVISSILVFWITATLFLSPAYADAIPFSMKVRSSLLADYSGDDRKSLFMALRLSILGDSLHDLGLSPEEAEARGVALEASLDDPVPTATAFDFDGSAPLTATPTDTLIPTETPIPTATPSNTPVPTKIPTKIPTKTDTPKPANTAAPSDSVSPVVADPGTITPTPGPLGSCSQKISVSNVTITDAAPSSGIKYVKLKYKVYDYAETTVYAGYIYSAPLPKCSGGITAGGGWNACYSGPPAGFDINIYPGFSTQPDYTGSSPFKIKVYLIVEDNIGKTASHYYGHYEMSNSCDDPPPPTDTPLPTDSTPPTIMSFDLSPAAGTSAPGPPLTTCTVNVTDFHVFDPAFSSGVSDSNVQLKYSSPTVPWTTVSLSLITGGWAGSDWDAYYGGTLTFSGVKSGEVIQVEGRVRDNASTGWQYTSTYYFDYTGPDC